MPQSRKTQVSLIDTPYYHCVSRCVRRSFLCKSIGTEHTHHFMLVDLAAIGYFITLGDLFKNGVLFKWWVIRRCTQKSFYQKGDSVNIERETLKRMVAEHQLEIMVPTVAACEGLYLQTLGTLTYIDLPWNPTKLEQKIWTN